SAEPLEGSRGEARVEAKARPAVEPVGEVKARVRAPPSVRMLAKRLGVDLAVVRGTGPRGIITKDDVLRHASLEKAEAPPRPVEPVEQVAEAVVSEAPQAVEERVPLRGIRRIMAERMEAAKRDVPHAYLVEEVDVTELYYVREKLRGLAEAKGVRLTLLPFFVKAAVRALKEFPLLNSRYDRERGEVVLIKEYNIGIAVDTEQGLVVTVLKRADSKGLFAIAREIRELAEKARQGKLSLEEVRGSTFSITNFGAIGGVLGIPVINPPETAILGLARVREEPRYIEGRLEPRRLVYVTLSFDHRVIEGAYAARFLARVKELLENPIVLLASEGELD
ncbi:MAG: 2-oxo acid dehydrogenase subunit E2, partial [Desulfurococcales archaeon]|nr:2-oxo acid dehydrogenase subunit E2 [Desulfurococcales archaeon]